MFETVELAPPDPILGLTEAFAKDPNPNKINLSVGVYKDENNATPVLQSVKAAEKYILEHEQSKGYKPIPGDAEYGRLVREMMFGLGHEILTNDRAVTAHSPGGTGGLRVAGDYLNAMHPGSTIWLSDPTWANHQQIFAAAGVPFKWYAYFDKKASALDMDDMLKAIGKMPEGDVILLHGCCHNPTGVDPTIEQWAQIGDAIAKQGVLPLVDFAYQGFGRGLDKDAAGLRALCDRVREMIICSSFSKNFGLYCERVGAITFVADTHQQSQNVFSQVKRVIRANYSNPPAHGAAIAATILKDASLRKQWEDELAAMRQRINGMRQLFRDTLDKKGITLPGGDNSFITDQIGMFSFSGLNKDQVQALKEKFAIYVVNSGRINVAGMTPANMDTLCDAIGDVL